MAKVERRLRATKGRELRSDLIERIRELKDTHVRAFKPAEPKTRYRVPDTEVRGLSIQVTDTGHKSFILYTRYPGSSAPARRALGEYGTLSLAEAREKARAWKALIKRGIDPRDEERRTLEAEQQKRDTTFAAIAEDFIREKLPTERRGAAVERELRRDLMPDLGAKAITEVTERDILRLINAKKRTAPAAARNLLALCKRLFSWAIDQRVYGLDSSPCQNLRPTRIIGERLPRDRILSDDELRALWLAADQMPYPHGTVYKILMLTGLRLNEAAEAKRSEFDMADRVWTVPAARMKGREGKARPHVVPITNAIETELYAIPNLQGATYAFSTSHGERPVSMGSKIKEKVDGLMLAELRKMAEARGEDLETVELAPWKNHDIRRTVRSGLARLRISEATSEAILAHVRPGIIGVYNHHDYMDEKREALEMWAARLTSIVKPKPANVVTLNRVG